MSNLSCLPLLQKIVTIFCVKQSKKKIREKGRNFQQKKNEQSKTPALLSQADICEAGTSLVATDLKCQKSILNMRSDLSRLRSLRAFQ